MYVGVIEREIRIQLHDCKHLLLIGESKTEPTFADWQSRRSQNENKVEVHVGTALK